MSIFKGLLYVKHGRLGTRSEGPDYYLQTATGDFVLELQAREPWQPDYHLEFFSRRMVEVSGRLEGRTLEVETIHEILSPHIPTARQVLGVTV
jgi:hypothetical protein